MLSTFTGRGGAGPSFSSKVVALSEPDGRRGSLTVWGLGVVMECGGEAVILDTVTVAARQRGNDWPNKGGEA